MQSIPGLKKCFEFVAGLSKKLLNTASPSTFLPKLQKSEEKSPPNQQKQEQSSLKPIVSQVRQQQSSSGQKVQRPKVICFETFLQNRPNPLKGPGFRPGSGGLYSNQKPISAIRIGQVKNQQGKGEDSTTKNQAYTKVENCYSNQNRAAPLAVNQIHQNRLHHKSYPPIKKVEDQEQNSADDELSDDERIELGKKDKKILKKNEKNSSVAQSLDINTDDMIFTYDDGDDISSIAAKSETTDQIEPQLLSFICKKASMNNFNKFENNFPSANMKKKSSHYQGETVPSKSSHIASPKQEKNSQIELIPKPKPKKRAFQLYPGETFQQFKKRILVQNKSSSSQNQDSGNQIPGKLIKKEEYEKILNELNSSISKMEEQRNKQASILVVERMVDESQNQESEQRFKRQQPYLDEIQNYKVWNNGGDNPSFRLYFRQV